MVASYDGLRNQIDMDLADEDTDGFLDDATGAGPFVTFLNSGACPDGLAHQLAFVSTANLSGINLTVVGTDADGRAQTEVRAGPNNNTVESSKYFKTITSITASSTLGANTMDVGWVDEAVSHTIRLDDSRTNAAAVSVDHNGTSTWTIQTTSCNVDRLNDSAPFAYADQSALFWFDDANFTGKSADTHAQLALKGRTAMRMVLASYSSGFEMQIFVTHPG
jgi:hypothetical protein